jgi:hypothetical protein
MGSMSAVEVIERLAELGCAVRVEGQRLKVRGPNLPEVAGLVSELRARRDDAPAILRDLESTAPLPEEVEALLPPGVRLVSYRRKEPPFSVGPMSVVNNAGKFYRTYLSDLAWRLEHPEGYAAPPFTDILTKLADGGLELKLETGMTSFLPQERAGA